MWFSYKIKHCKIRNILPYEYMIYRNFYENRLKNLEVQGSYIVSPALTTQKLNNVIKSFYWQDARIIVTTGNCSKGDVKYV